MDLSRIRKTPDGKLSVVDVIRQMKSCTAHYAAQLYKRLVDEERVPGCEQRSIAHTASESTGGESARTQCRASYRTPIATAAEIIEIIWQLPGASDFRRNCAKVCVRYLGGDESLVDEIRANRRLQEQLREEEPDHPARIFGEAVESSEAVKRKREELELKRLDAEISLLEYTTKRQRVQNYVECYASLEAHGVRMDDRNRQAVKDYVDSTLQPNCANAIQDTPAKELCIRTFLLQHTAAPQKVECTFGRAVAKLKREELVKAGKEPTLQKKTIYVNGQAVQANLYFESDRALMETAWMALQ